MTRAAQTLFVLLTFAPLSGCYEPGSTYDPQRGRYVPTEEYRRDQIRREIDRWAEEQQQRGQK